MVFFHVGSVTRCGWSSPLSLTVQIEEMRQHAAVYAQGDQVLLARIEEVLQNDQFLASPRQYVKQWMHRRDTVREWHLMEEEALRFFLQRAFSLPPL